MLPLSQRKALFEKIKSVPKPIARFGESVTPAMLSKHAKTSAPQVPASEPAWKRRRDKSPDHSGKSFLTPGHNQEALASTPGFRGRSGFETKKNLFESNPSWKNNDIAKSQDDAKKKDMEMLMNRFKQVQEEVQELKRSPSKSPERYLVFSIFLCFHDFFRFL